MFKWLPLGTPSRTPLKISIKGVEPGSQEARALVDQHRNEIEHFHKTQHSVATAQESTWHKKTVRTPRLTMTYTMNHGQEMMHIEVNEPVGRQVVEKKFDDIWDYALIEVRVPNVFYSANASDFVCMADLTLPIEHIVAPGDTWPVLGQAATWLTHALPPDPMINAPQFNGLPESTLLGTNAVAAFALDLRPARGATAVVTRLRPIVRKFSSPVGGGHINASASIQSAAPPPLYDPLSGLNKYNAGDIESFTQYIYGDGTWGYLSYAGPKNPARPAPSYYGPFTTIDVGTVSVVGGIWVFDETGTPFNTRHLGPYTFEITGVTVGDFYRHFHVNTLGVAVDYTGPIPVPGEVHATLFKSDPGLVPQAINNGYQTYGRWLLPGSVEAATLKLADVSIPVGFNTPESPYTYYGLDSVGAVVIDHHKGTLSFQSS